MTTMIYFFVFIILIIIITIGIIILLYNFLYKRQVNHSLKENRSHFIMMEPIHFVFSILFIILIIFSIVTQVKLTRMEDLLNNNSNKINDLNFQLSNRISNLNHEFEEKLNELINQDKWIIDASYDYKELTEDKFQINVNVNFSVKELEKDISLYLIAINKDNHDDRVIIEIVQEGILSFSEKIALDLNKNYSLYLQSESENLDYQEKLFDINIKDHFSQVIKADTNLSNNNYHISVMVYYKQIPNFKIETINIRFHTFDGEYDIKIIDISEQVSITDNGNYQIISGIYTIDNNFSGLIDLELIDGFGNQITSGEIEVK